MHEARLSAPIAQRSQVNMVDVTVSIDIDQYSLLAQVAEANGFGDVSMSQLIAIRTDDEVNMIRRELGMNGAGQ